MEPFTIPELDNGVNCSEISEAEILTEIAIQAEHEWDTVSISSNIAEMTEEFKTLSTITKDKPVPGK